MKSVLKFLVGASILAALYSGVAFASTDMAPDVLVKQTADDVLTIIKNDKEIQAGNQQKLYWKIIHQQILAIKINTY